MTHNRRRGHQERRLYRRWVVVVALVCLVSTLGCSLGKQLEPLIVAALSGQAPDEQRSQLATRTPWPTYTVTLIPSPTPTPTVTLVPSPTPMASPTSTDTPIAMPTLPPTFTPIPIPTPQPAPTAAPAPARPAATPTPIPPPTPTPTPDFPYKMVEVYRDYTSNQFLTVYVAIVNYQEIPIGGIKAVGSFEPGGLRHESPLSKWFFDARTAPGAVVKVGSVKFEPPGGIQAGTWFIHLENEQGVRLSADVDLATDPNAPQWFYIKFKQPNPSGVASVPTPGAVARTVTPAFGITPTTPAAATSGWSFVNTQQISDASSGSVIIYGDMVNNTGAAQQIAYVTGTFQDSQGRSFAGTDYTYDYWPIEIVPPGSKVPFELNVYDVPDIVKYTLSVVSQPAGATPRQDFEMLNPSTFDDQGYYCVNGQLRNSGGSLGEYLVVVAVLFNAQDQVINFDSYEEPYPEEISGSQTSGFEICIDPYEQSVARYELRAWGQ